VDPPQPPVPSGHPSVRRDAPEGEGGGQAVPPASPRPPMRLSRIPACVRGLVPLRKDSPCTRKKGEKDIVLRAQPPVLLSWNRVSASSGDGPGRKVALTIPCPGQAAAREESERGLQVHAGGGFQCASGAFRRAVGGDGSVCSTGGRGNPYGNAAMGPSCKMPKREPAKGAAGAGWRPGGGAMYLKLCCNAGRSAGTVPASRGTPGRVLRATPSLQDGPRGSPGHGTEGDGAPPGPAGTPSPAGVSAPCGARPPRRRACALRLRAPRTPRGGMRG
jgi:hypothetical protein